MKTNVIENAQETSFVNSQLRQHLKHQRNMIRIKALHIRMGSFRNRHNHTASANGIRTMHAFTVALGLFAVVGSVSSQCTGNDHPSCSSWKTNGYCTGTAPTEQKKLYCGIACGLCNTDGSQTGVGGGSNVPPCEDANASCASWAATGFCTRADYSTAMKIQYCCKTCRPLMTATTTTAATTDDGATTEATDAETTTV